MDLDAIEAAEKAMTPGPWEVVPDRNKSRTARRIFGESYIGTIGGIDDSKATIDGNAHGIVTLRNAAPELTRRIRDQDAEIKRLRRFAADMGTTCYSCESCGHARTTRECLRCEVERLRALCGQAAFEQDIAERAGYGALSRGDSRPPACGIERGTMTPGRMEEINEVKRRIAGTYRLDSVTMAAGLLHDIIESYESEIERERELRRRIRNLLESKGGE